MASLSMRDVAHSTAGGPSHRSKNRDVEVSGTPRLPSAISSRSNVSRFATVVGVV